MRIRGSQDLKNHVYLVNPVKYLSGRTLSVCNETTPYVTSPNVTERAELYLKTQNKRRF